MSLQKNIGKNTIGDNKKMTVDLHTYNMSTHDLSYVWRNTQAPGTLVPNMCILAQKGDTFYIDIESHVLTHPTTGPLFGSFKHENMIFTVPIRLYNSWLHNNRTKIGLNISDIKLPQLQVGINNKDLPTETDHFTQINPSCVLAYLGIRGYGITNAEKGSEHLVQINAVPLIGYYDIFKNYYANTQEENFYVIAGTPQITSITMKKNGTTHWVSATPNNVKQLIAAKDVLIIEPLNVYKSEDLTFKCRNTAKPTRLFYRTADELGEWEISTGNLTIENIPTGETWEILSVESKSYTQLVTHQLEDLDTMRDQILQTPGNTAWVINGSSGINLFKGFGERNAASKLNTTTPQYGLCLKTYNSDLLQNWVNTEWIDGVKGINEISAVDVSGGKLTMDSLNLAQKVYNMLNRIAVSGGTYRDWLETIYTGGNYMERCETPMFEGGMSQEIVFQEVVSNSASEDEPLGTLAGRGISTDRQRGGTVKIKVTEPCFIIGIGSITPRVDYNQGNEFWFTHKTLDDLHKPALDGIGYQDSLNWQRAWWDYQYDEKNSKIIQPSTGKTVAWINYMTNVNKTYGNFAVNNNEAFMVLNRNYEYKGKGRLGTSYIGDLTTYIDPVKFNYIFADTNIEAMNFWVQTKFDVKVRRLISAKQIPNL